MNLKFSNLDRLSLSLSLSLSHTRMNTRRKRQKFAALYSFIHINSKTCPILLFFWPNWPWVSLPILYQVKFVRFISPRPCWTKKFKVLWILIKNEYILYNFIFYTDVKIIIVLQKLGSEPLKLGTFSYLWMVYYQLNDILCWPLFYRSSNFLIIIVFAKEK